MFVAPGTLPDLGHKLSRDAAQQIARNWWLVLLNGVLLIVAGVLIFSIDWTIRSLATFIGVLFIVQGVSEALTTGIDARVRRVNVIAGLVSIAAGILIIVWPGPGLVAVAIVLGAWLIVTGTIEIITAAGIWAVAIGVTRIVLAFEIKRLPDDVDQPWAAPTEARTQKATTPKQPPLAAARS